MTPGIANVEFETSIIRAPAQTGRTVAPTDHRSAVPVHVKVEVASPRFSMASGGLECGGDEASGDRAPGDEASSGMALGGETSGDKALGEELSGAGARVDETSGEEVGSPCAAKAVPTARRPKRIANRKAVPGRIGLAAGMERGKKPPG